MYPACLRDRDLAVIVAGLAHRGVKNTVIYADTEADAWACAALCVSGGCLRVHLIAVCCITMDGHGRRLCVVDAVMGGCGGGRQLGSALWVRLSAGDTRREQRFGGPSFVLVFYVGPRRCFGRALATIHRGRGRVPAVKGLAPGVGADVRIGAGRVVRGRAGCGCAVAVHPPSGALGAPVPVAA
ncbi:hypothetical protein C8R44DRAFT_733254 [Mycena epipterygia]|nr:hypothetical protein C8R44DRAFT_733254 [Mycena epipterygia]